MNISKNLALFALLILVGEGANAFNNKSEKDAYWAEQKRLEDADQKSKPKNIEKIILYSCEEGASEGVNEDLPGDPIETEWNYDQFTHPNVEELKINKIIKDLLKKAYESALANGFFETAAKKNHCSKKHQSMNLVSTEIKYLCNYIYQLTDTEDINSGAHPTGAIQTSFWSGKTGKKIELRQFFVSSGMQKLEQLVSDKLIIDEGLEKLREEAVTKKTSIDLTKYGAAIFTLPDDFEIDFSDMEITGHADGAPDVHFKMNEIRPLLDPKGPLGCLVNP